MQKKTGKKRKAEGGLPFVDRVVEKAKHGSPTDRVVLNGGLASGYLGKWLENFGDSVVRRDTKSHIRKNTKNISFKGEVKKRMYHQTRAGFLHLMVHPFFYHPFQKKVFLDFFRFALSRGARKWDEIM